MLEVHAVVSNRITKQEIPNGRGRDGLSPSGRTFLVSSLEITYKNPTIKFLRTCTSGSSRFR